MISMDGPMSRGGRVNTDINAFYSMYNEADTLSSGLYNVMRSLEGAIKGLTTGQINALQSAIYGNEDNREAQMATQNNPANALFNGKNPEDILRMLQGMDGGGGGQ